MKRYRVIYANSMEYLEEQLTEMLEIGWLPAGGIAIERRELNEQLTLQFFQAMYFPTKASNPKHGQTVL